MASFTNSKYQFLCAVLVLLHTRVLCFQYKVGDLDAWGIPTSGNRHVYTNWAQKHHFQIGDSLCKLIFLHSIFPVREKWRQNQKTHIRSWYFTPFLVNKTRPICIFLFYLHHFSPKTQKCKCHFYCSDWYYLFLFCLQCFSIHPVKILWFKWQSKPSTPATSQTRFCTCTMVTQCSTSLHPRSITSPVGYLGTAKSHRNLKFLWFLEMVLHFLPRMLHPCCLQLHLLTPTRLGQSLHPRLQHCRAFWVRSLLRSDRLLC